MLMKGKMDRPYKNNNLRYESMRSTDIVECVSALYKTRGMKFVSFFSGSVSGSLAFIRTKRIGYTDTHHSVSCRLLLSFAGSTHARWPTAGDSYFSLRCIILF